MNELGQLISNVGFPVVMCLILVYFMNVSNSKLTEAIDKLEKAIVELIAKEDSYHKGGN